MFRRLAPLTILAAFTVAVLAACDLEATASTAPERTPAPAATMDPVAAQRFTGTGPSATRDFHVSVSTFQMCHQVTRYATRSDGRPSGIAFFNLKDSTGRTVAQTAADASTGELQGCTTARTSPGMHYVDINAGVGIGWIVRIEP